jgi:serine protease inhibitor
MQLETLQNVPKNEPKSYLRVATISSKTALCFFYIGADNSTIQLLSDSFKAGLSVNNFEEAKKTLNSEESNLIDAFIIDLPYNEKDLKAFYFFLKNRSLEKIPIIYNEHHLKSENGISISPIGNLIFIIKSAF